MYYVLDSAGKNFLATVLLRKKFKRQSCIMDFFFSLYTVLIWCIGLGNKSISPTKKNSFPTVVHGTCWKISDLSLDPTPTK